MKLNSITKALCEKATHDAVYYGYIERSATEGIPRVGSSRRDISKRDTGVGQPLREPRHISARVPVHHARVCTGTQRSNTLPALGGGRPISVMLVISPSTMPNFLASLAVM